MSISQGMTPTSLRCEYAEDPLSVDALTPRLSWAVEHPERGQRQSAYQILVASAPDRLAQDAGDLWDTGKLSGANTVGVRYSGQSLRSRQQCWWKVRTWDRDGRAGEYSEAARFGVGLLSREDWQAHWIGSPEPKRGVAPFFRTTFELDRAVAQALLYVCGLGYCETHLNGAKVGDNVLDPGWTDYDKRVLYVTYDVADRLRAGPNALGAVLGEGWYGNDHSSISGYGQRPQLKWLGFPCLILQLHIVFSDGTETCVGTGDPGWWVSEGPILANSVYDGERYDGRLELVGWDTPECSPEEGERWAPAVAVDGPKGALAPQLLEPIQVVKDVPPISINTPRPGVHVLDMGQNIAGWVRLSVEGPAGAEVTLKYAEILDDAGLVNQEPLRGARATDCYVLRGGGTEVYEPRFTYHGFRYVQIEGAPGELGLGNVLGRVVRSAVAQRGQFTCSNQLLNAIQRNVLWTEEGNLHSLPTDCPQRDERMGWLNDMTVRVEEAIHNFDLVRLLAKWEDDIADTQQADGAIADTAPHVGGHIPADPVTTCFLLIPWLLFVHYGDTRTLERHYASLKGWNDYLASRAEDDIVTYSHWGDWAGPAAQLAGDGSARSGVTPGEFMSTGYYYYNAQLLARFAGILGRDREAADLAALADRIGRAFNRKFFDPATGRYARGNQSAQAFALYLGLVPEDAKPAVVQRLLDDVADHENHLTTGNLCTKYLLEALTECGAVEVAYRIATQTSYPSWGYMIARGATTIWERWELETGGGMNSHNHPMYGTVSSWFYKYLAGISFDPSHPACEHVVIKPYLPGELTRVEASVQTVRGEVGSKWDRSAEGLRLDATIPCNSTATICLPLGEKGTIREGDTVIWEGDAPGAPTEGVTGCRASGDRIDVSVGSGHYRFLIE